MRDNQALQIAQPEGRTCRMSFKAAAPIELRACPLSGNLRSFGVKEQEAFTVFPLFVDCKYSGRPKCVRRPIGQMQAGG